MCIINIYVFTYICTCYITALFPLKYSGTLESDVQGEQMRGDSLQSILPVLPNNGKHNLYINIRNDHTSAHCSINLWNIYWAILILMYVLVNYFPDEEQPHSAKEHMRPRQPAWAAKQSSRLEGISKVSQFHDGMPLVVWSDTTY